MSIAETRTILVVDDDTAIRTSLAEAVAEWGDEVRTASDATSALARIAEEAPDLVLSDVRMPGMDGVELLRLLRQRAPSTDVILMTAYEDMSTVVAAMREGALDFLVKPLDLHALHDIVDRVFEDRTARNAVARGGDDPSDFRMDTLVGRDPRMLKIFKMIGQAAASQVTVLVRGESGTGKELVARAIHFNSDRAKEPFVPVNCAALPSTLLESELFGHTRGAFTGAVGARRGRFALAGRGTIFLDEIGDTTPDFQSKLLRVLQNREFFPVGAEQVEHTDARVIAATHQNLESAVAEGRFREDLYYRLRVLEVEVPPLRDRAGDLPLLAKSLVRRAAVACAIAEPVISDDALHALLAHDWPGNVRELENCLTRAVVLAAGNVIRPEHLHLRSDEPLASRERLGALQDVEREHVARVLAATGGEKLAASRILGISRPRLDRLLRKYRLEP
jgi:DNA-binding NtrC family response regulator